MNSPLFPALSLALSPARDEYPDEQVLLPQLPELPLVQTGSLQIYIIPAEKHLFVQGFKPAEYEGLPPSLLRGCLVVRVLKGCKIKTLSLLFKGSKRTDWPEGIPPKRTLYAETNDIVSHTWPFYNSESHLPDCGADFYRPPGRQGRHDNITHLSLGDPQPREFSPSIALNPVESATLFAANLIKRATSPLGQAQSSNNLTPVDSMPDLTAVLSSLSLATLGDSSKAGYFSPGDYVYNFEHPLPALTPETVLLNFGKVNYFLEATVNRVGTFKANLVGRLPVEVVRVPSDNSVEENDPILIERDWEDQLRYEIVVGSKLVVLDTYLPLAFRFIPLYGKVALHRIRVYLTENCNYYCHNKTVHRAEPVKKFLLLEHKALKNKSILSKNGGLVDSEEDDEVLPRELEFQMFVPSSINKKYNYSMSLDTALETIQCDHWIKISLRISKQDPDHPEKRKHFEISIDSPIHLCSPLAAHCNTLLPAYEKPDLLKPDFLPRYTPSSPPMSPEVTLVDHGAGHLILSTLTGRGGLGSSTPVHALANLRSGLPFEFQHISSTHHNEDPIERDGDLHLEANLYQPEEAVRDALNSPQATPFTPIGSPMILPTTTTQTVTRNPSVNPPSFDTLGISGVNETSFPPAYEREDPLSVSPRRDHSQGSRASKGSGDSRGSRTRPSIVVNSPGSIKDLLGKQLDKREKAAKAEAIPEASFGTPLKNEENAHDDNNYDITDSLSLDFNVNTNLGVGSRPLSRRSSVSLTSLSAHLEDTPLDQTLPLLSDSTDLARPLMDSGRRLGSFAMSSLTDLVDEDLFADYGVNGSLSKLRNPRITKHYQDSVQRDRGDTITEPSNRDRGDTLTEGRPRKSFGVLPGLPTNELDRSLTGSSLESEMTYNEIANSDKSHEEYRGPELQSVISR